MAGHLAVATLIASLNHPAVCHDVSLAPGHTVAEGARRHLYEHEKRAARIDFYHFPEHPHAKGTCCRVILNAFVVAEVTGFGYNCDR
ncbi:hypothetical protein TASIC1_0006032200 [Trichoderma asperellum]|uniref:Secreted protein n=1 Tax=Trichoderma asperellum TaxID=101201 RepID=A0A6V8QVQ8_TRIAP|nr:hypothetical protein TASIC1_0006032200 [Trichoderma asperellum]